MLFQNCVAISEIIFKMGKFLTILIILGIIFAGVGYYYYQKNTYSKAELRLEILGPETAELGEEVEYLVKYKNNSDFVLEEPKLVFQYPEYSVVEDDKSQRQEVPLDDIYPGAENTMNFKGRLFGKENESRVATVWLSYKPKNLNARYERSNILTTVITRVPLTFEFDLPTKIESGKEFRFRLNYFSNVDFPLSSLRIFVEYPQGFEFIQSLPKSLERTEWELALLNKTDGGRIEISGRVFGEPSEQRVFRARLGIWHEGDYILLKEAVRGVEIIRPSIFISWQVNGSPNYHANAGEYLQYEIFFKNTGEKALENLFLMAELDDNLLDLTTLQSFGGKLQEGTKRIIWDHTMVPQLRLLGGMEEGKVEFWVKVKDDFNIKNPIIRTGIILSQVKEQIDTKVNSKLIIAQKGYFSQGPFANSGPIPPQVGQTTTYTVFWQVQNLYNDVKNIKVKARLPLQVRLTGEFSPKESKFFFDPVSREIVWDIGDLSAGVGVVYPPPEIFFQLALAPDAAQKGQPALLISEARVTGEDSWSEVTMENKSSVLNTTLPDDETVSEQQGIVQ